MNVLLVHSGNAVNSSNEYTFVKEQGEALTSLGIHVSYYAVTGKGVWGYLSSLPGLKKAISENQIDLVHAHYGLCGALAVLQRKVPVIITFHNGETLTRKGRVISSLAARFSAYNIFVAQHIHDGLIHISGGYRILPCGIDLSRLEPMPKADAIAAAGLPTDRPNILFGGSFSNTRKNYPLAKEAISTKSEGSPQVVKEAMACNCPIVATRVADIPSLLSGVTHSYVTGFDADEIASKIDLILQSGERSNGRERIYQLKLDNPQVAASLLSIYKSILSKKKKSDETK